MAEPAHARRSTASEVYRRRGPLQWRVMRRCEFAAARSPGKSSMREIQLAYRAMTPVKAKAPANAHNSRWLGQSNARTPKAMATNISGHERLFRQLRISGLGGVS